MVQERSRIRIYDYTDYRKYLLDYYHDQKQRSKVFSYRYFARKAGINSIGLYKDIIEGKRHLGRSLVIRFSQAIGHSAKEAEYFENMVFFNEADSLEEKKVYFERMMTSYQSKAHRIEGDKYEFFSKWYYVAVREVLSYFKFKDDYRSLANAISPPIRPDQAEKAIKLLSKIGLIRQDEQGNYKRVENVISTGDELRALTVANFQKEMMDLGKEALERHSYDMRDISTLTLSIDKPTFERMKEEVIALRKKFLNMAVQVENADCVYQLNCQFFPLSRKDVS